MKIVGLITEYNPFHNGHQYHIEKAKEITGADKAIVVMSGNFVQRGTPAIMPKHLRAEIALKAGASAVLELPVYFASGSAEHFARGAISVFEHLGCIDSICFGTECSRFDILEQIARILSDEPEEYRYMLRNHLKSGSSFPSARQKALLEYLPKQDKEHSLNSDILEQILSQPNNILGIEYIKALYQSKSSIRPYAIRRKEANYHDQELGENYSSASAIRKLLAHAGTSLRLSSDDDYGEPLLSDILTRLEEQVPKACILTLEEHHRIRYPVYANDFSLALKYKLLSETKESLSRYADVSEDLANRIINSLGSFVTFDQFCALLKTKELTYSRVNRALLHILLNLTKDEMKTCVQNEYLSYAHILGFRKDDADVLTELKKHTSIPLISKLTKTGSLTPYQEGLLKKDIYASNLYESVVTDKFKTPFINEYEHPVIRI